MKRVIYWFPAIVWMVIIFTLSSRPTVKVSDETAINFLFFKFLHIIEYMVLMIFNICAWSMSMPTRSRQLVFRIAFLATVLFAMSDEFHQTFVPTREGRPRDVIIDAIGATLSWILIRHTLPKAPKKLQTLVHRLLPK